MSARQPFIPTRPASRLAHDRQNGTLTPAPGRKQSLGVGADSATNVDKASSTNAKPLNIAALKKSKVQGLAIVGSKGFAGPAGDFPRIAAPRPSSPLVVQVAGGALARTFKQPSLPLLNMQEYPENEDITHIPTFHNPSTKLDDKIGQGKTQMDSASSDFYSTHIKKSSTSLTSIHVVPEDSGYFSAPGDESTGNANFTDIDAYSESMLQVEASPENAATYIHLPTHIGRRSSQKRCVDPEADFELDAQPGAKQARCERYTDAVSI